MSYRASHESYLTNKLQYVQNKAMVELKISDHFGWYMGGIQVFREKMINYYQIFLIIKVEIQTMVLEGFGGRLESENIGLLICTVNH